jgi:hypothetical protein
VRGVTRPAVGIPLLAAIWGGSYLCVHLALRDMGPWVVTWGRVTLGLAVVLPLALASGGLAGLRGRLLPVVVTGVLQIVAPTTLIATGQQ